MTTEEARALLWSHIVAWDKKAEAWLARAELVPGTLFLLSPLAEYDVDLNGFFADSRMVTSAWRTQHGYARDLAAFLTFLWLSRDDRSTVSYKPSLQRFLGIGVH